jgi:hypothetical protein
VIVDPMAAALVVIVGAAAPNRQRADVSNGGHAHDCHSMKERPIATGGET